MYRLVSIPQVSVGDLPLHLPLPDAINNGGYIVPSIGGSLCFVYSGLDLLIAGLEADYRDETVTNLVGYFDKHRKMVSEMKVVLSVRNDEANRIHSYSVLEWKTIISLNKDHDLLKMMRRNAPLTFKWGVTI